MYSSLESVKETVQTDVLQSEDGELASGKLILIDFFLPLLGLHGLM